MTNENPSLYETPPSQQSPSSQRDLAEHVVGTRTFGTPGIPESDSDEIVDDVGIPVNAPRIWSPDLHAALFPRDDLTPAHIRDIIEIEFEHSETGADSESGTRKEKVLRLPADAEQKHGTSWAMYSVAYGPKIVGSKETFYQYWAADANDAFCLETDVDYQDGTVTLTVWNRLVREDLSAEDRSES